MSQDTVRRLDDTDRERGIPHRGWLLRRPTFGGLAVALAFWWWSLQPSMLPRTPSAQGAVSGLSAAVGYLLGTLAGCPAWWPTRSPRRCSWPPGCS